MMVNDPKESTKMQMNGPRGSDFGDMSTHSMVSTNTGMTYPMVNGQTYMTTTTANQGYMPMPRGVSIQIKRPWNQPAMYTPMNQMPMINPLPIQQQMIHSSHNGNDSQRTGTTSTSAASSSSSSSGSPRTQRQEDQTKVREKMSQSERKRKEINMMLYTRLFQMSILTGCGYVFTLKKKRKQSGKNEIYSISKIISEKTQEVLFDRREVEETAKKMLPTKQGGKSDTAKKNIEKYVDVTMDNYLIELLDFSGYKFECKENPLFKTADGDDQHGPSEGIVKRTITLLHVCIDNVNKALTREDIFNNYQEYLESFVHQLSYD